MKQAPQIETTGCSRWEKISMSVITLLGALLVFGFAVVGLVGFLGWRSRMRTG
jgi:hypothetical protein